MNALSKPMRIEELVAQGVQWIEQNGMRFEVGSREWEEKKSQLVQRYEIYIWDTGIFGRVPILKVA
jgi:hypothetical protein